MLCIASTIHRVCHNHALKARCSVAPTAAIPPLTRVDSRISCRVEDEQVEAAWDPEPMFDMGNGLSAREMDLIEDRLGIIRTWIQFMGLGELEVFFFDNNK